MEDHQFKIQAGDYTISLEPSSSQQTIEGKTQSEDKFTGTSLVKDDSTKLDTTKGVHKEKKATKADIKSNKHETIRATSKVLEPAKIIKDVMREAKHEESERKGATMSKKSASDDKVEEKNSSTSERILLDLQNDNKVKVHC